MNKRSQIDAGRRLALNGAHCEDKDTYWLEHERLNDGIARRGQKIIILVYLATNALVNSRFENIDFGSGTSHITPIAPYRSRMRFPGTSTRS